MHFTFDSSCFKCPGIPETLLHLFRDCPKARLVWNSFYIPPSMAVTFNLNWNGWIYANLLQDRCFHMNSPWNIFFSFTCWHIWKWRCKYIFDRSFNLPFDMKGVIPSYMDDWAAASAKVMQNKPMQNIMVQWIKPLVGTMKINVDGSLNGRGYIGAGGIIRDYSGSWQGGFMINLGNGDILQDEIWALFYGMVLALRYNQQLVEFESDSATLIKILSDDTISLHPLATIISNCKQLAGNFSSCSFKHIHREGNMAADFLAKSSLGNDIGIIWLNAAPPAMENIILDDIAGACMPRRVPADVPFCSSFHVSASLENEDSNVQPSDYG